MVNFDFSNISLKNPKPIQGGSFFSTIKNNNEALIIQTPKIKTKKGITHTNKHIYTDLVFENEDNEFVDWVENLQENVRDIILTKSETWFNDPVTLDEIEYNWNDSFRTYKQTKQLLRTFIHKNKGVSSSILKVYDSDYKSKHINDIKPETPIICILEILGLKFTNTTFQVDFCLRQVMILENKHIFNEPLIKISTEKVSKEIIGEKNVKFNEKPEEITLENNIGSVNNLEVLVQDKKVEVEIEEVLDTSSNTLSENLEEVLIDDSKNLVEINNEPKKEETSSENNEISQFVDNVKEVNLDDLEKEEETNEVEKKNDELQEVNLTFDEEDAITLKNPNEIYLDIYSQAREKAKKAKQEAIKAYLEAKRIKELYMLEIVDSSEDESDSEDDSEQDEENELFSEN